MRMPRLLTQNPKHREESLKLLATGLQNLALAVFVGIVLAPFFNASIVATPWQQFGAFLTAGVLEGVSLILLHYIPTQQDT